MRSNLRTAAWIALLLIAGYNAWMLVAGLIGLPGDLHLADHPENARLIPVIILLDLLNVLPPVGVLLLLEAWRRGGGRWSWRWVLGFFLVAILVVQVWSFLTALPTLLQVARRPYWESPALFANVAAIIPLWVLFARRRGA